MGILLILFIGFIGSLGFTCFVSCRLKKEGPFIEYYGSVTIIVGKAITYVFGAFLLIAIQTALYYKCLSPFQTEMHEERYKTIIYMMESSSCRDENGYLTDGAISLIEMWNEDVSYNKKIRDNFFTNLYTYDCYDQLETIDLEVLNINKKERLHHGQK